MNADTFLGAEPDKKSKADDFLDSSADKFLDSPPKQGFSPSAAIIKTAVKTMVPWARLDSALVGGAQKLMDSDIGQAATSALKDRPELQPLQATKSLGLEPLSGGAISQGAQAAEQTLSYPIKSGVAAFEGYQSSISQVQDKTTETAIKHGVDPYVASFAGMAAGTVADAATQAGFLGAIAHTSESYAARNIIKDQILQLDEGQAKAMADLANESLQTRAARMAEDQRTAENLQYAQERQNTPSDQLKGPEKLSSTFQTRYLQRDPIQKNTVVSSGPMKTPEASMTPDATILGTNDQRGPFQRPSTMIPGEPDIPYQPNLSLQRQGPQADFGRKTIITPSSERPPSVPLEVPENYQGESWSKSYYKPEVPQIIKPDVVFGAKLEEGGIKTPTGPIETVSRETNDLPGPASYDWHVEPQPTVLSAAVDRSIKEMGDLNTRLELESPNADWKTGLKDVWNRFIGFKQVGRLDTDHMVDSFADYVPDRSRRALLTMYSQLKRAPTLEEVNGLRLAYDGKKSKDAKQMYDDLHGLLGQNLSLNTQEQGALKTMENYFQGMGQEAQKIGVLGKLREVYGGPHLYMSEDEANQSSFKKLITGRSKFAAQRTFDNFVQASEAGYLPRTLDAAELIGTYHSGITKSVGEKYLIGALEKHGLVNYNGEGQQIKTLQPSTLTLKNGEKYAKQAYAAQPEVADLVHRTTEDLGSLVPYTRGVEKFYALKKATQLWGTVFHPFALAVEAGAKGFSPTKFQAGLDLMEKTPELVRSQIRAGLTYDHVQDWGDRLVEMAGKDKNAFNPMAFVRKMTDIQNDVVFRKYMVGLKVYHANELTDRLVSMGVEPQRAMQLAVTDANVAFGGLNMEQAARSENVQRAFKLLAYSPDWTESKIRQLGGVVGKGYEDFIGPLSPFEKQLMMKQSRTAMAKLVSVALATSVAQKVNPANQYINIDTSAESGFKDFKKLAALPFGDISYVTTKESNLVRDFITLANNSSREPVAERVKKVFTSALPFSGTMKWIKDAVTGE